MTYRRNTLDNIASVKIGSLRKIESAMLKNQEACHVEYHGDDIFCNKRETPYVFRSVPQNGTCKECNSHNTYEVYHYLTLVYARCNDCKWEYCYTQFRSKTTRALQYLLSYAYATFSEALAETMAQEKEDKRLERNRVRRQQKALGY